MRKYSKFISGIALIMLTLTGPATFVSAVDSRALIKLNTEPEVSGPQIPGYDLIVSNPAKGVYVYGKKQPGKPYFERVLIKTKLAQREFNWKATTKNPGLILADLTGTGQESVDIIFVTAYGTGLYESQIHILSMDLKREIPVENPAVAAKRLIRPSIQGKDIVLRAGNKEYRVRPSVGPGGLARELQNLQYGAVVAYKVENNKLKATVTVQTNPSTFLGEFTLVYNYKGGRFVPEVESFKKF